MIALSEVAPVSRIIPALIGSLCLLVSPAACWAQAGGGQVFRSYRDGRPLYGLGQQAEPSPFSQGGTCAKWCLADVTPCDPGSYKIADRRCSFNQNGVFP